MGDYTASVLSPSQHATSEVSPRITNVKELESVCRDAVQENTQLRYENDSLRMELDRLLALASPLFTPADSGGITPQTNRDGTTGSNSRQTGGSRSTDQHTRSRDSGSSSNQTGSSGPSRQG